MKQMIDWFYNTTPFMFCVGVFGLALFIRVIYEIFKEND